MTSFSSAIYVHVHAFSFAFHGLSIKFCFDRVNVNRKCIFLTADRLSLHLFSEFRVINGNLMKNFFKLLWYIFWNWFLDYPDNLNTTKNRISKSFSSFWAIVSQNLWVTSSSLKEISNFEVFYTIFDVFGPENCESLDILL